MLWFCDMLIQPITSEFESSEGHITVSISRSRIKAKFSSDISWYIFPWSHFYNKQQTRTPLVFESFLVPMTDLEVDFTLIHLPYKWRRVIITLSASSWLSYKSVVTKINTRVLIWLSSQYLSCQGLNKYELKVIYHNTESGYDKNKYILAKNKNKYMKLLILILIH